MFAVSLAGLPATIRHIVPIRLPPIPSSQILDFHTQTFLTLESQYLDKSQAILQKCRTSTCRSDESLVTVRHHFPVPQNPPSCRYSLRSRPAKGFNDLPAEVKEKIYGYFREAPSERLLIRLSVEGQRSWLQTRKKSRLPARVFFWYLVRSIKTGPRCSGKPQLWCSEPRPPALVTESDQNLILKILHTTSTVSQSGL